MEPFSTVTSAILSGIVYDFVKKSTKITLEKFKSKVKGWLIDDETAEEFVITPFLIAVGSRII